MLVWAEPSGQWYVEEVSPRTKAEQYVSVSVSVLGVRLHSFKPQELQGLWTLRREQRDPRDGHHLQRVVVTELVL